MEGFANEFISPESNEAIPFFEFTFCNNNKVLHIIPAPTREIALYDFSEKEGREFGSIDGDSFTEIPTKGIPVAE